MTSLLLGLALSSPAQPPAYRPYPPAQYASQLVRFPQVQPVRPVVPLVAPVLQPRVPQYPVPGPVAPQVLSLKQFSRVFAPTPGRHHYWIVHPRTGQPVAVCFTLPNCGKLDRFEVGSDWIEIEFDRPDFEVEINFRKNGRVEIEYDD